MWYIQHIIIRLISNLKVDQQVTPINFKTLQHQYKDEILEIAEACMVDDIKVFGSILNGDLYENSDIDFLVKMKPNSGFAIGGLKWRLEELLGRRVDVVSVNTLHHLIKNQVLKKAVYL